MAMTNGTMGTPIADRYSDETARVANTVPAGLADSDARTSSTTFTDADLAELATLRKERQERETTAAEEAERNKPIPSHYLTLDDGTTVESQGVMTEYNGHRVMNAAPIPAVVLDTRKDS